MAEGGGSGITTLAVLQSLAQARHRWGEHAADAIWDAATVKLILGGLGKARDLDDVSRLLGEIDEPTTTYTRGRRGERSQLREYPSGPGDARLRAADPAVRDRGPAAAPHPARRSSTSPRGPPGRTPTRSAPGRPPSRSSRQRPSARPLRSPPMKRPVLAGGV